MAVPRIPPTAVGDRYGRLTVVALADVTDRGHKRWLCQCECGSSAKVVFQSTLRRGTTVSCGCWRQEMATEMARRHDGSETREWRIWSTMRRRCTNPMDTSFQRYGARGITVCERWRESFSNFFADMGPRPTTKHSIDRIDNDGPYAPENCRWATPTEQARNRRDNVRVTFDGREMTMAEWASAQGINRGTLRDRLRDGWSVEDALTKPARALRRHRERNEYAPGSSRGAGGAASSFPRS